MTLYLHVRWRHEFADEPTDIYSEVEDGWESRKVEVYADGRVDCAGEGFQSGSTYLAELEFSSLEEIAAVPGFDPEYITGVAFEEMWRVAVEAQPHQRGPD